jgi:ADP-ribose pyrophosphatase YjhB (NUDIX family)
MPRVQPRGRRTETTIVNNREEGFQARRRREQAEKRKAEKQISQLSSVAQPRVFRGNFHYTGTSPPHKYKSGVPGSISWGQAVLNWQESEKIAKAKYEKVEKFAKDVVDNQEKYDSSVVRKAVEFVNAKAKADNSRAISASKQDGSRKRSSSPKRLLSRGQAGFSTQQRLLRDPRSTAETVFSATGIAMVESARQRELEHGRLKIEEKIKGSQGVSREEIYIRESVQSGKTREQALNELSDKQGRRDAMGEIQKTGLKVKRGEISREQAYGSEPFKAITEKDTVKAFTEFKTRDQRRTELEYFRTTGRSYDDPSRILNQERADAFDDKLSKIYDTTSIEKPTPILYTPIGQPPKKGQYSPIGSTSKFLVPFENVLHKYLDPVVEIQEAREKQGLGEFTPQDAISTVDKKYLDYLESKDQKPLRDLPSDTSIGIQKGFDKTIGSWKPIEERRKPFLYQQAEEEYETKKGFDPFAEEISLRYQSGLISSEQADQMFMEESLRARGEYSQSLSKDEKKIRNIRIGSVAAAKLALIVASYRLAVPAIEGISMGSSTVELTGAAKVLQKAKQVRLAKNIKTVEGLSGGAIGAEFIAKASNPISPFRVGLAIDPFKTGAEQILPYGAFFYSPVQRVVGRTLTRISPTAPKQRFQLSRDFEREKFIRKRATVVIRDKKGRILYEIDKRSKMQILPGGDVKSKETVRDAAYRELLEETGLKGTGKDGIKLKPLDIISTEAEMNVIFFAEVDDLAKLKLKPQKGEVAKFEFTKPTKYKGKTAVDPFGRSNRPFRDSISGTAAVRAEDLAIGSRVNTLLKVGKLSTAEKTLLVKQQKPKLEKLFGKQRVESLEQSELVKESLLMSEGLTLKDLAFKGSKSIGTSISAYDAKYTENFLRNQAPMFTKRAKKFNIKDPSTYIDKLQGRKAGQFKRVFFKPVSERSTVVGYGSRYDIPFSIAKNYPKPSADDVGEYALLYQSGTPQRFTLTKGKLKVIGDKTKRGTDQGLYFQPPTEVNPFVSEGYLGISYLGLARRKGYSGITFRRTRPTVLKYKGGEGLVPTKKAIRGKESEVIAPPGMEFDIAASEYSRLSSNQIKIFQATKSDPLIKSSLTPKQRIKNIKARSQLEKSYENVDKYYVSPTQTTLKLSAPRSSETYSSETSTSLSSGYTPRPLNESYSISTSKEPSSIGKSGGKSPSSQGTSKGYSDGYGGSYGGSYGGEYSGGYGYTDPPSTGYGGGYGNDGYYTGTPPPTRTPPPVTIPIPLMVKKDSKGDGYNVEVREIKRRNGKVIEKGFIKVNTKTLTKSDALALGARAVDNSAARTFKIVKTNKTPKQGSSDSYFNFNRGKFRGKIRKGRQVQGKGEPTYIEKSKFAIDTQGEIKQITVKGWKAQRKKNIQKNNMFL